MQQSLCSPSCQTRIAKPRLHRVNMLLEPCQKAICIHSPTIKLWEVQMQIDEPRQKKLTTKVDSVPTFCSTQLLLDIFPRPHVRDTPVNANYEAPILELFAGPVDLRVDDPTPVNNWVVSRIHPHRAILTKKGINLQTKKPARAISMG